MKKITILLSSVLTLLLITSNNASYAFAIIQPVFAEQPNKNVFKGQLRKGNVFKGNVRILQGDSSGGIFNPISKYSISDEPSFFPNPNRGKFNPISKYSISDEPSFFPNPNRGKFNPISKYSISDEPSFIPKPDAVGEPNDGFIWFDGEWVEAGLIGENGKVGLSVGPIGKDGFTKDIYYFNDGSSNWNPDGQPEISNEQAIMTRPYRLGEDIGSGTPLKGGSGSVPSWRDREVGLIGENGKVGLSVGPIGKDGFLDGTSNTVSPKGVPLKFIEGEWVEPLANVDLQNITEGNSEPSANVAE